LIVAPTAGRPDRQRLAGAAKELRTDLNHFARTDGGDGCDDSRDQRPQILDAVANADDNDSRDANSGEVLLVPQLTIRCQDDGESGADRCTQENAVSETEPALLVNGDGFTAWQFVVGLYVK
jgi:hypothetical protein